MAKWWVVMRKISMPNFKGKVYSSLTKMRKKEAGNFQGELVHNTHFPDFPLDKKLFVRKYMASCHRCNLVPHLDALY